MNLNNPSVSRGIGSLTKYLTPKEKFELTGLTLKYTELSELPERWQKAIKEEMKKNAAEEKPKKVEKAANGFVPPQAVRSNAKRGLELREKHGRGGTAVGVARARDLSNGKALSLSTIKRMVSYFARHEVDKKGEGWGKDSAGYIAWLLWGGDAGKSWANRIARENDKKDKATMTNMTTAFFDIIKADKNADGTMLVYGKATDDSLDIDQQICDPVWLDSAMPEWFKSGGNIREQHSNIAAGVAKEYEKKADGHYIHALVVDPVSVKKVDTGVLKGFSIGIKNPRVVRDQKAANGRIIDGKIVEVSLVDRPANPNCQLVLAKSAEGDAGWWKVEELIEKKDKKPDYQNMLRGGGKSEPADKELYNRVVREAKAKFDVYPSAVANAWVVREYKKRGGTYKKKSEKSANSLEWSDLTERETMTILAKDVIEMSAAYNSGDLLKFDKKTYDDARQALARLIAIEAEEMGEGHNEEASLSHLIAAVHHLFAWYEGEEAEGEVMETEMLDEKAVHKDPDFSPRKDESKEDFMKRCKEAGKSDSFAKKCWDKYMSAKEAHSDEEDDAKKKSLETETESDEKDDEVSKSADDEKDEESEKKKKKSEDDEDDEDDDEDTKKAKHKGADVSKCLECGCNAPGSDHGATVTNDFANVAKPSHVTTAEMYTPDQTPKSAEVSTAEVDIEAIVEQAIKSATESIKSEIANLMTAKEAAEGKANRLETELAEAKTLAVAGGPKRTAKPVSETSNDLLVKAAAYNAKANATTDPTLAKGYKALATEFLAKAQAESK